MEVCRRLKESPETKRIPVIFVTALTDETDEAKGIEIGAIDYVTKPVQRDHRHRTYAQPLGAQALPRLPDRDRVCRWPDRDCQQTSL